MTTLAVFQSIQNSGIGTYIGHQGIWFGAIAQMFHIAGLISLLSGVLLVSLRLLGWGLSDQAPTLLARAATPLVWGGATLLLLSGLIIFIPSAALYEPNPAFWTKVVLLISALLVHLTLYRKATSTDTPNPALARLTAVLSIGLWFGVGFAGRAIGFM